MDFFKIIQSVDELLYEIVGWLLFYPLTLWRVIRSPIKMMLSAESELVQSERKQFDDVIAPPLFLLLTLILIHVVELGVIGRSKLAAENPEFSQMIGSDFNLTAFRVTMLSILPLAASIRLLRARREVLDRQALKGPFYSQCYAAALFAIMLATAIGSAGARLSFGNPAFLLITAAALIWLFVVEAHWFAAKLDVPLANGLVQATILTMQWLVLLAVVLAILR